MPLESPVTITGRIVGAYRDEPGFQVEGQGIVGLTEIINFLLDNGGGGGEPDGNGIYSGSGNVPDNTVATAVGYFTIRHDNDGQLALGDPTGPEQTYIYKSNRTLGMKNLNASTESDLVVNPAAITLESNNAAPDQSSGQILIAPNTVRIRGENSSGNIVEVDVTGKTVKLTNIPNYANDAAADADSNLPAGGLYTVTGSRALQKKP